MFETAVRVREQLKDTGYNCTLINARFVKPIDEEMLLALAGEHELLVTIEENVKSGGYGERVLDFVSRKGLKMKVLMIALPDDYIEHGSVDVLRREVLMDDESIAKRIMTEYMGRRG